MHVLPRPALLDYCTKNYLHKRIPHLGSARNIPTCGQRSIGAQAPAVNFGRFQSSPETRNAPEPPLSAARNGKRNKKECSTERKAQQVPGGSRAGDSPAIELIFNSRSSRPKL